MSFKNLIRIGVCLGLWTLASGCGQGVDVSEAPEEGELQEHEDSLYVSSAPIWPTLSIPVCWENPNSGNASGRSWVRDQIEKTWEAASYVDFTGWGTCSSGSGGIRILIADTAKAPHVKGLGERINGMPNGMVLNFTFQQWEPGCQYAHNRERCIRYVAVHEFGHALGFAHEQNRSDTPASCREPKQGSDGDILVGQYDPNSVMNYCNPRWNNAGELSWGDVQGVRQFYGSPAFASLKRDAVDWDNGKVYFFNGEQYTRYDLATSKVDSGYPRNVIGNWAGWPSSWRSIDAAVRWNNGKAYFFNGNQYLRYDVRTDKVDSGYPRPIAGNWRGWPSSWTSVDAIVRWNNGKVYFFRGSQYLRFDMAADRVDSGYPRNISGNWPGVWTSGIEYAVSKGNKAYFFKGKEYVRYDMDAGKVDPGYPMPIVGRWNGVPF